MKNRRIKLSGANFCIVFLLIFLSIGAIVCVKASNFAIPEADITYTEDWPGTLVLDSNQTVKISGINHDNTGTAYGPAIKICDNSTVSLVFEGSNTLVANPNLSDSAAGIQVEEGSTVNIYGANGSSLTVTGGKDGAGIGGFGYSVPSANNHKAGNINIYSGNITAIGGSKGAGIGSGNHSSASDINIYGGHITALGTGGGAGIGTGYGTSGGAAAAAGVGFYNGGNITISGGTVRAAGCNINFDNFDPYNTDTLYTAGYSNAHAAGIGGGYGASSGVIIIEGDADVIAIGTSGGAGIGSGRGTSDENKYDAEHFDVNITIRGNSKVVAIAGADTRSGYELKAQSGAGIGLGRGCTLKDEKVGGGPKGTVKIEGNANVYAVALNYAQAIGGSRVCGDTNTALIPAHLESVNFSGGTVVTAVNDGQREAVDCVSESDLENFLVVDLSEEFFTNYSDFFTEDKFPLKITAVDAEHPDSKITVSVPNMQRQSFMVRIKDVKKYNFKIEDYKGENGETIFLSNSVEANSAEFFSDSKEAKRYDVTGLTARLDRNTSMNSDYGELKVKIRAPQGIFEYGSTFSCSVVTDPNVINDLNSKLDKKYADRLDKILYFDIGVKDRNGEVYDKFKGGKVKIYIEVPEGWNKDEVFALFVKSGDDETFADSQKIEVIDGVTYLSFEIDHFSGYALVESKSKENNGENEHNQSGPEEENAEEMNNYEETFLTTGDKIYIGCTMLILVIFVSLASMFFLSRERGKRFRK